MRIISWNIFLEKHNTNEVAELIEQEKVDIICLQEGTRSFNKKTSKMYHSAIDLNEHFEKSHPYNFFAPSFVADIMTKNGKITSDFGGQIEQGNHLISNHKITKASSIFYYNNYGHWFDHSDFRKTDWARNLLSAIVDINGKPVKIINIHGMINDEKLGNEMTEQQSEFIIKEAQKDNLPTIIAGDFNLSTESKSIQMINKYFKNLSVEYNLKTTRSVSSGKENQVIDYIFINDQINVKDFKTINTETSDHLPLIMDFDIK